VRTYTYNYQNRMASAEYNGTTANYTYNPDGIRVQAAVGATTNRYLIDPYNHTGYAQVLKLDVNGDANTIYVLGHDVIGQATGSSSPELSMSSAMM